MAFTKLYLTGRTAPYTPATIRGAWDDSAGAVTRALDPCKTLDGGVITSVARAETSTTDEYDVLLYRGVSGPLAAQELTVDLNVLVAVNEQNAAQNAHWHIHAYTTVGNTDVVREIAVDNYREAAGTNEWPTTAVGLALNAVTACHIHSQDGDRLVVEIGYASRNTVATSYQGALYYGTLSQVGSNPIAADMTAGADRRYYAGHLTFSSAVAESTITARATQGPIETLLTETTRTARVSQAAVEALILSPGDPQRVTQLVAETAQAQTATMRASQVLVELLTPSVTQSRVSQLVLELLYPTVIESRVSQALTEVANAGPSVTRMSQHVIELLAKVSTYCGPPAVSPAPLCGKPDVLAWLEWTVPMKEN